ncbi:MAG: exodeoxyribonuclease VII large subunit [Steroidobacteraceae bacterium]|nr:exodeoxyribonuclease VII large subunit [Steroidobacteraceae bacterium]
MPAGTMQDPGGRDIYTVSRLNREARGLLEAGLPSLWITGELSNLSRPASGHWYFTLKDEAAQVRCAMFRQRNLLVRAAPRDGMQVLLRARVGLYEARGDYQLVVDHLEEAGEGELRRRFEALKLRLAAEGLFDAARKRAPPRFPRRIGVVTSATGAALRDVLHVLARRCPVVPVLLYPVPVQGAGAARDIAAALALADARAEVDVLLLVRGGGSLEDLWAFNEESLARAIAATELPVICGIGHEVDFTIADFVADVRAPTPSAAAELAVPDAAAWIASFELAARRLAGAASRALRQRQEAVARAGRRLQSLHPAQALAQRAQRLDELQLRAANAAVRLLASRRDRVARLAAELAARSPAARVVSLSQRFAHAHARLRPALRHRLALARAGLESAARGLQAVSPLATLARGYAIATRAEDGAIVTDAAQAPAGTDLAIRLARGRLRARVTRHD